MVCSVGEIMNCEYCSKEFKKRYSGHKGKDGKWLLVRFCSPRCSYDARIKRKKKPCIVCDKLFKPMIDGAQFCSLKCFGESIKKSIKRECLQCGKYFIAQPHIIKNNRGKFCSQICKYKYASENRSGANHPNWKGGDSVVIR